MVDNEQSKRERAASLVFGFVVYDDTLFEWEKCTVVFTLTDTHLTLRVHT